MFNVIQMHMVNQSMSECPVGHYHKCFAGCKMMVDYADDNLTPKMSHWCYQCKDRYWESQMEMEE
jgi:hypothetical protein